MSTWPGFWHSHPVRVDEKTAARYAAIRDAGQNPLVGRQRPRSVDPFLPKIEELVDRSQG